MSNPERISVHIDGAKIAEVLTPSMEAERDYTDEEFSDLVIRELEEQASSEEVEYLWSSVEVVDRWRAALAEMVRMASLWVRSYRKDLLKNRRKYLNVESGNSVVKHVRVTYEMEKQDEIDKIRELVNCGQARLIRLSAWRKHYYQAEERARRRRKLMGTQEFAQQILDLIEDGPLGTLDTLEAIETLCKGQLQKES